MKLISCNNVETNRYQLEVAVDAKEFNEGIEKAYQKAKNKIALPGFRKGKTPRAFIEKYYGKDVFFEDAIEEIYPEALDAAIAEACTISALNFLARRSLIPCQINGAPS